jgi:hypothetical protein
MIYRAGAGPKPIPRRKLTVDRLRDAIQYAVSPTAKEAAKKMAQQIQNDVSNSNSKLERVVHRSIVFSEKNGVEKGVQSFYQHLPLFNMRCDLDPSRLAVWWSTRHVSVKLNDAVHGIDIVPTVPEIERLRRSHIGK